MPQYKFRIAVKLDLDVFASSEAEFWDLLNDLKDHPSTVDGPFKIRQLTIHDIPPTTLTQLANLPKET
jgi:hypothetical protein